VRGFKAVRLLESLTKPSEGWVVMEELGFTGLKLLAFLQRRGESTLTYIPQALNVSHSELYYAVEVLRKKGLIEVVDTWAGRRLKLTEKGARVARLLVEAEEELGRAG